MNANRDQKYLIQPKPPIVHDELAHIGAGLRFSQSPTNFLAQMRKEYGDTFLVDVFGYKLFCVFSPAGLKSLYAAAEDEASFGMATFDMLGFKTPLDIFLDADIDLFYELLLPQKVAAYVEDFSGAVAEVLAEWGSAGQINVFDEIRTLEQRVGFRVWMGEEATRDGVWQAFKMHFDVLSQENAFVSPQQTLDTLTSGKAKEKQAVAEITTLVGGIVKRREAADDWPEDNFTFLYHRFRSDDPQVTLRKLTHNIINANQGFLSNLYAALSWSLINLKQYPATQQRLEAELADTRATFGEHFYASQAALDSMRFCEQLLMESVRMAQRSITLRKVMREIQFDCGDHVYTIRPGVYITTMLSVINTQTPELARFDPDHYQGRRIDPRLIVEGKETISTFGHGSHACPAQKFSHNMCKVLLAQLLEKFEFGAPEGAVEPSSAQMGGVARASADIVLGYRRKKQD
ncbi:MAG: cytochrome P450 [Halioglobus sp.]|nr:cytochrome P450 [Halioglobus sp.]